MYDALDKINIEKVVEFIKVRQNSDGSFTGDKWGETDTRFSYCCILSLSLLNRLDSINKETAVQFIDKCQNFDGGYGTLPNSESHAGQIFCCLGALSILGKLDHADADLLGWWLCERQVPSGGLNGRPEKKPDVCYSWWVLSSLAMLGKIEWINQNNLISFILSCQDDENGGIADRPGDMADIYHTFFGVAGLSFLGYPGLNEIDPAYALPMTVLKRMRIR